VTDSVTFWAVRNAFLVLVLASSCTPDKGNNPPPLASEDPVCPTGAVFTASPVDPAQIDEVFGIGTFGAPGHVIPNEHGGIWVQGKDVPFLAPSAGRISTLRRTVFTRSSWRQGEADYAISFRPCAGQESVFGHVASLSPELEALVGSGDCSSYDTDSETVESCNVQVSIKVQAGQQLGTVGGDTNRGFDWGHHVDTHVNHFANPSRLAPPVLHAVCPYDGYEGLLRDTLYAKIKRTGEPRCGTLELDKEGTAQGIWVDKANQANQGGDERMFVTLGPNYDSPDLAQRLALAPASLGGAQVDVPISHDGRKNRAFNEVAADGTVFCYVAQDAVVSFFLALSSAGELRIERVPHGLGASPCDGDPAAWNVSSAATTLVR